MAVKILEDIAKEKTTKEISLEEIKEIKEIKAYAFKKIEGLGEKDYLKDKYSCGWSVCHCATYGCN